MISDITSVLKFLTDPQIRGVVKVLFRNPSRNLNWKKDVKTAKAKFSGDESYMVAGFVNTLIRDMQNLGVSKNIVERFEIIFDELTRNAFTHGCQENRKCRVRMKCTYSPWFIVFSITDGGTGYDFQTISSIKDDDRHGLQIVGDLANQLIVNKKGNTINITIMSNPVLEITPEVVKYKGKEILILKIENRKEWNYLTEDWYPLKHAVNNAAQRLFIIDCSAISFPTLVFRIRIKSILQEFKEHKNKYIALVVNGRMYGLYDFSRFNSSNLQVFSDYSPNQNDDLLEAKKWLSVRATK